MNKREKLNIFVEMLKSYSKLSKDPRTKVGAAILRADLSVISMGYNGFPSGFPDSAEFWDDRVVKNSIVIHAEENAIDYARGNDLEGSILICSHYPCPRCAAKIVKRKIKEVYYFNEKREDHNSPLTDTIFKLADIECEFLG